MSVALLMLFVAYTNKCVEVVLLAQMENSIFFVAVS
jgi:hypothetical protein